VLENGDPKAHQERTPVLQYEVRHSSNGFKTHFTTDSALGKISAPIPIPDDEFPIRSPGTGIAVPLGTDGVEAHLRASIATELDNTALQTGIPILTTVDPKLPIQSTAGQAQPFRELPVRRTNQPSSQRDSGTSVPSGSSMGKPQRKKSSFRSALGRLFGKKSKNGGTSPPEQGAGGMKAGQHRSVSSTFSF
jgi:hypothetical protein